MTMQFPDTVIYNGEQYRIEGNRTRYLFEPYLEKHHIVLFDNVLDDIINWRGYTAAWMIENDMLFLVDIRANIRPWHLAICMSSSERYARLDYFFPADEKKIFADWYSGELAIIYKSNDEVPEDEQYMVFAINKGRVTSQKIKNYEEYYGQPYRRIFIDYPYFDNDKIKDVEQKDDALPF